tara:strand:+ start:1953 stop:2501 length:549 start_codon:yes stop_codon:yes gene_type:complete
VIRVVDFGLAFFGISFLFPVFLILVVLGWLDTGSPFFTQARLGRNKKIFILVKFRTMKVGTRAVATHEAPVSAVTRYGSFLRKTKLDELPQLWNVLKGDMSLVGPRPNLPIQSELTDVRSRYSVYSVRPGITGLAQISGIDMSQPELLAEIDQKMILSMNLVSYFHLIWLTLLGKGYGDQIR